MTAQIESTNEYMNSKLGRSFICHTNIFGLPIHWWRPATNKKTKDGREALARANNDYQIRTSESRRDFRLTTNERTQRCCQNMFAQHTPNRVYYYRTGCCLYCLRIAHNKLCERIFLLKASIRAGVLDGLQHEQKSARAYIHRHIHHRVNRSYERARYAGAAQCNCFRLGSPTVQSTAHIVNSTQDTRSWCAFANWNESHRMMMKIGSIDLGKTIGSIYAPANWTNEHNNGAATALAFCDFSADRMCKRSETHT